MKKNLQRFGASVLAAAMVAQSVALPAAAETTKIDSSVAQSVAASAASAASAVQSLPKFTSTTDLIKQTAQMLAAQGEVHELEQDDAKLEATAQSKAGMSLAALENALADAMYANAAAGKINTEAYGLNKDEMASVMAATIKTYHLSSAVTDLGYETNAAGVVTAVTFTGSAGMVIWVGDPNLVFTLLVFFPCFLLCTQGELPQRLSLALIFFCYIMAVCAMLDTYLMHVEAYDQLTQLLRPMVFGGLYFLLRKRLPPEPPKLSRRLWRLMLGLGAMPFLSIVAVVALSYNIHDSLLVQSQALRQGLVVLPMVLGSSLLLLLALLTRHVRQLWQAKVLMKRGVRGKALAKPLGLHPFIAEKLGRSAARFSDAQLRQSFLDIADADYMMKTGGGGNELLEHIVIELCA